MEEEKEYFIWEPETKINNNHNNSEEDYPDKIKITEFNINPINEDSDKRSFRGIGVRGLIKIVMKEDNENINSFGEYIIKFRGNMKMINNLSEREKALKQHYNEVSRDCMRINREDIYKEQVKKYFPKEELSNKLNELPGENLSEIEIYDLNCLIRDILKERNLREGTQSKTSYHNFIWQKAIEDFMLEREYAKEGDKYVKKQK